MRATLPINFCLVLLLFCVLGCNSDLYYRDKAVSKARAFVLSEDRALSLYQREYVKYNKPVIMAETIVGKASHPNSSAITGVETQVCISWVIPDCEKAYVVFGVSDNHLRGWTPNRLILKRYQRPDRELAAANRKAVDFAVNNFLYLPRGQINRIRFSPPELCETKFVIDEACWGADQEERLKAKKSFSKQHSFFWKSIRPGWVVFVCGVDSGDIATWRPMFGQELTQSEFIENKVSKPVTIAEDKEANNNDNATTPNTLSL